MVDEKAVVDADKCIDCGACVDTCPVGAITL
jgi:ferredoxin